MQAPKDLSSCIAAAVVRDTRGAELKPSDRFNFFPANPLVSISFVMEGQLQTYKFADNAFDVHSHTKMSRFSKIVSSNKPVMSWSEGDVFAITIGFYPDAWIKLCAPEGEAKLLSHLETMFLSLDPAQSLARFWVDICEYVLPLWQINRHCKDMPDWRGSDRLIDWSYFFLARVMSSTAGKSLRTMERRIKQWTGASQQQINHYASIEILHDIMINNPDVSLAELALTSGYSDQSHMGR